MNGKTRTPHLRLPNVRAIACAQTEPHVDCYTPYYITFMTLAIITIVVVTYCMTKICNNVKK